MDLSYIPDPPASQQERCKTDSAGKTIDGPKSRRWSVGGRKAASQCHLHDASAMSPERLDGVENMLVYELQKRKEEAGERWDFLARKYCPRRAYRSCMDWVQEKQDPRHLPLPKSGCSCLKRHCARLLVFVRRYCRCAS